MHAASPSILYLAHDIADAGIARRVAMLEAGGATVTVAGFARSGGTGMLEGRAHVLGQAREGRLARRVLDVLRAAAQVRPKLRRLQAADGPFDAVVARNIEMLALARRAALGVPLVYESLDIHRLMTRRDPAGAALRPLERRLSAGASLLLTSSPAFVREHFGPSGVDLPVQLVENRVFGIEPSARERRRSPSDPIVIGWFGALRCRRSLTALAAFTRAGEGRFELVLRGRPAPGVLDDLAAFAAREPFMRFEGAYAYPHDLPAIYGETDLAWAVDFYEAGQNSDWLLPNRIYEAGAFGVPSIAMAGSETGRFLAARGLGITLPDLDAATLERALGALDDAALAGLAADVRAEPRSTWICDDAEARRLVGRIVSAGRGERTLDGSLVEVTP